MARIGVFSGSFNPVHTGHVALARHMLLFAGLDEVWLLVSPHNPLKEEGGLMDEQLRLHYLELALADEPGLKASDIEFGLPRPSYTWQTLQALRERWPEHQFSLIIGSDNMLLFDRWKNWQEILRNFDVIVYPRPGYAPGSVRDRYPQMRVVEAPLMEVSSTQIRQYMSTRQCEELKKVLPPAVFEEITAKWSDK